MKFVASLTHRLNILLVCYLGMDVSYQKVDAHCRMQIIIIGH